VAAALVTAYAALAFAQAPELAGTWQLDAERSRVSPTASFAGLVGAGAPATLHITQPANGTLVIESQINEGQARLYKPGVRVVSPVTVGPGGTVTSTSRWEGRALLNEGTRESSAGTTTLVQRVKEVVSLSADGRTLTIEITVKGPDAAGSEAASTLIYTRITDVGPCKTWPTPCKTPPLP
jgi:hypothetical protein